MIADEFRTILDRFHEHLTLTAEWLNVRAPARLDGALDIYSHLEHLHAVWCALSRECALMKAAEQPVDTTVKPTRSLPESPSPSWDERHDKMAWDDRRPAPAGFNAEEIGKLQARVARLEDYVDSLWESHHRLQGVAIGIQGRELERLAERTDGAT